MRKVISLIFSGLLLLTATCYGQKQTEKDPLQGKTIGVLGDSYVRNHNRPIEESWHYKFARKHGMKYFNYGINGSSVVLDRTGRGFGKPMYLRYKEEMRESLDYIIVIAGHNDAALLDSIGIDLFKEKLGILCDGLIEKYPAARIFFFTSWVQEHFVGSDFEKVVDATLEVCGSRAIPVFDSARRSGIYAQSQQFRNLFFQQQPDAAHLNAKGHDRFLPVAENFIMQYVEREK